MPVKEQLRIQYKQKRLQLNARQRHMAEDDIAQRLLESPLYKNTAVLLCYSALPDEIQTNRILQQALADHKAVFLPACKDAQGAMDFYKITGAQDLHSGFFGIQEPDMEACSVFRFETAFAAVCVVPGLAFDSKGYRLGYGKGYYDRFLRRFSGVSVGLCYESFLCDALPAEEYDRPVDYIVTERRMIQILS